MPFVKQVVVRWYSSKEYLCIFIPLWPLTCTFSHLTLLIFCLCYRGVFIKKIKKNCCSYLMFLCVDHPKLCKEVWVVRFWQVSRACYSGCQMFKNMLSLQFFADFDPKYLCFHKAKPGNSYLLSAILFWLLLFEWRFLFHGPTRAMSKNYGESNKLMITFFCKLDLSKFICVMDIIKQCTHHHLPQLIRTNVVKEAHKQVSM